MNQTPDTRSKYGQEPDTIKRSWESTSVPITSESAYQLFAPTPTLSGVPITKHTVFGLPAFKRGVDIISNTFAGLPCYPYKKDKTGGKLIDTDHRSYQLLTRSPNRWQSPFDFKRTLCSDAVWAGNGYAFVDFDELSADPLSMTLLCPENTWPIITRSTVDASDVSISYITEIDGKRINIPAWQMIHLKGIGHHYGFLGMRLIDCLKESLGLGIATIKYASVFYKHGGSPSMVIEMPEFIRDKEQLEEFREGFAHMHSGVSNAHRIAILQGGAKLSSKPNLTAEETQLLESREFSQVDCANILGLPPHMLGSKQTTSYGSLEQENLGALIYSFDPWFNNAEEQFERVLLTEVEKQRNSREICFDRSKLKQADHKTTVDTWANIVNNGLCLPSYAAAQLNLPTIPKEDDKLRLLTTVQIQGEEPEPAPMPPMPPQPPEAPKDDKGAKVKERLAKLTGSVLERFFVRMEKATEAASKKDDWAEWLTTGILDHRAVLVESLEPVTEQAEAIAEEVFRSWQEELQAVTRDMVPTVFRNIKRDELIERIMQ